VSVARVVIAGDCIDALREMPDASVDAVVTDPPYGLSQHTAVDTAECLRAWVEGREYRHGKGGFMGRAWDSWVPGPEVWREVLRVLKPGGHACVFAGTRTVDLMGIALRLAGFEIRDSLHWIYGTGFPKSHNIGKAIDKGAGAEREVVGVNPSSRPNSKRRNAGGFDGHKGLDESAGVQHITAPATPEAAAWEGWGTALKPSHEPVVWARKPFSVVTAYDMVAEAMLFVEAALCLISCASPAGSPFASSLHGRGDATPGFAEWLVGAEPMQSSAGPCGLMDTSKSPATAETFWSTVLLSRRIWAAACKSGSTSTTETETALTIASKTLKSLALATMPPCITEAEILTPGYRWIAKSVETGSSDAASKSSTTLSRFAPGSATLRIVESIFRECASIADALMLRGTCRASESSAVQSATTQAGASSHRPIILARKPLDGTVAANVLAHGAGGLNVDGCRVGTDGGTTKGSKPHGAGHGIYGAGLHGGCDVVALSAGRWPPNIVLTHAHGCTGDRNGAGCVDGCVVGGLGAQSGVLSSPSTYIRGATAQGEWLHRKPQGSEQAGIGDTGTAARFFPSFKYCAKASRSEREAGLVTPEQGKRANPHPTVKPIALMRWLVRLVTPPGGVVLDPFTGSGTTGCAAALEGFGFIGCEMDEGHADLARRRIAHWAGEPLADGERPDAPAKVEPEPAAQLSLL
jgi:DNA modification methylase